MTTIQERAVNLVLAERASQDLKWGEQNHEPLKWEPILHEETGEVSKEVNFITFDGGDHNNWLYEMTQVAAVALAAIESELRRLAVLEPPTNPKLFDD